MEDFPSKSFSEINMKKDSNCKYNVLNRRNVDNKVLSNEKTDKCVAIKRPVVQQMSLYPTLHEELSHEISASKYSVVKDYITSIMLIDSLLMEISNPKLSRNFGEIYKIQVFMPLWAMDSIFVPNFNMDTKLSMEG